MKTKITITSIILLFAFSSFQFRENNQNYVSITENINGNFDVKQHKSYVSQALVSCSKCHDCQKDNPIVPDSTRFNIQNYIGNLKEKSFKISKTETKPVNKEKTNNNDVESTANLKRK